MNAVLDDGALAVQHVDELGVVAAGRAADPASGGDVGDDDGVPLLGGALEGGQVPCLAARRLGAAHNPPQPIRPGGAPAEQVGDLRDVLVFLDHPSWSTAACQAPAGSSPIACSSSASVMAQSLVNSTVWHQLASNAPAPIGAGPNPAPASRHPQTAAQNHEETITAQSADQC